MTTLELFSGTKSFSKVAVEFGHSTLTLDNAPSLNPDIVRDVMDISDYYFGYFDILWASPPCTAFSVASIGRNMDKDTTGYIVLPSSYYKRAFGNNSSKVRYEKKVKNVHS